MSHAKKYDCTSAKCIFNWNKSVTGHKQGRVGVFQGKTVKVSCKLLSQYQYVKLNTRTVCEDVMTLSRWYVVLCISDGRVTPRTPQLDTHFRSDRQNNISDKRTALRFTDTMSRIRHSSNGLHSQWRNHHCSLRCSNHGLDNSTSWA
jgi:hypothetical protein